MAELTLSGIYLYPVKSCAGVDLTAVELDRFGPSGDRRWMLVDPAGQFLSQRQVPAMALIRVQLMSDGSLLLERGEAHCRVARPVAGARQIPVTVWSDTVAAVDAGNDVALWLTQMLGRDCRLVYMPDATRRPVDTDYARQGETVGFADGFPLLLISEGSLAELNKRMREAGHPAVPMDRFRPNLVVSGCAPFAEDGWKRVAIGDVELDVAKPCARCAIPSIDQSTAQRDPYINRTLAAFRRFDGQILFGQNLLYRYPGRLRIGSPVVVRE